MKSQKFTEQQLKDLVAGKEVVTTEPVKKGEHGGKNVSNNPIGAIHTIYDSKGNILFKVGELVQALNEKGEKQWYCPDCKKPLGEKDLKGGPIKPEEKIYCCENKMNPLLVRLKKIEEKKFMEARINIVQRVEFEKNNKKNHDDHWKKIQSIKGYEKRSLEENMWNPDVWVLDFEVKK